MNTATVSGNVTVTFTTVLTGREEQPPPAPVPARPEPRPPSLPPALAAQEVPA
jgi:hypothetical protein